MKKFEYMVENKEFPMFEEDLNKRGEEGWELVVEREVKLGLCVYVWKREKGQPE